MNVTGRRAALLAGASAVATLAALAALGRRAAREAPDHPRESAPAVAAFPLATAAGATERAGGATERGPSSPSMPPQSRPAGEPQLPQALLERLVAESRAEFLDMGMSERYFDAHFALMEARARGIRWRFTVGEYETAVYDGLNAAACVRRVPDLGLFGLQLKTNGR